MRKILCFLTAFIFLLCSRAVADEHLSFEFTVYGTFENQTATMDLYEQDSQSILVSSIFRDFAVSDRFANRYIRLFDKIISSLLTPEKGRALIKSSDDLLLKYFSQQPTQTVSGIYSGYLFEYASSVSISDFRLSDFTEYLQHNILSPDTAENNSVLYELFSLLSVSISEQLNGSDPIIHTRIYDSGKYFTVLITDHDEIYLSLSADCSSEEKRQYIVSYKENGHYYFAAYHFLFDSQNTVISSSAQISNSSFYHSSAKPLVRELLTVTPNSETSSSFIWFSEPQGVKESLSISGTVSAMPDCHTDIKASVSFDSSDKKTFDIHLYTETLNEAVTFPDMLPKSINQQEELAEIQIAVASGILTVSNWCYSLLPAGYQNLLMNLLFH